MESPQRANHVHQTQLVCERSNFILTFLNFSIQCNSLQGISQILFMDFLPLFLLFCFAFVFYQNRVSDLQLEYIFRNRNNVKDHLVHSLFILFLKIYFIHYAITVVPFFLPFISLCPAYPLPPAFPTPLPLVHVHGLYI